MARLYAYIGIRHANDRRRLAFVLMPVILALVLIGLAGLGGWFVVRAAGGRRR
jgi:hypothetical protein